MLEVAHLPKHSHEAIFTPEGGGGSSIEVDVDIDVANTTNNTLTDPVGNILATPSIPVGLGTGPGKLYAPPFEKTGKLGGVNVTVSGSGGSGGGTVIIGNTGGGNAFPIIQPFVGMRFIMATAGVYPPRP
ncbi:hypothetical protein PXH66_09230 [Synoicihabitans lomoniglobus]|uniref:Phage tail collar domain-containing protein n=1 Tax=Synoicihabitans lomoniglobus TaxID=2909285 RepID=A0AAF0CS44_9BACT|nr:hypothetical protein PXH66_09230 [Opitutaceae bacterium LMO-M01]